ncbi:MAG: FGGY-family carbohydrate kinase [Syntrophales bacterium]
MNKRFFVGVDSGTSVVKVVLADLQGEELAVAVENTPVETPQEGWSEFDLTKDWQGVVRAISKLLYENQVAPEEIMAVAVTGKAWGCCYLDRNNEPVRKGILWNDARSGPYIKEWAQNGVLSEVFRINGNYYWPGDYAPITRWLIDKEPDTARSVTTALLPSDWIVYKLTGKIKVVHGDVSSLFDIKKWEYSDTVFDLLGISSMRDKFPNATSSIEVAGEVTREAAEATHLKVGTPVVLAGQDVSTCAAGVGVIDPGDVCIILGTAHIVSTCLDDPIVRPETGTLLTYVDGKYLRLVAPMVATTNLDWYLGNFCQEDYEKAKQGSTDVFEFLEEKLQKISPGANGVIYHPYLNPAGERCPFTKLTAKANFFGLGMYHTRYHLLRAIYEGVAFSGCDCLLACNVDLRNIMLSGGGAKSAVWGGIEADVLGKTVKLPAGKEFGAKGAIITAMVAMGLFPDHRTAIQNVVRIKRVFEPHHKHHVLYSKVFQLYRSITSHLWEDWDYGAEILREAKSFE